MSPVEYIKRTTELFERQGFPPYRWTENPDCPYWTPLGKPIDPSLLGEDFSFQLLPDDWDHFEPMMVNALHRLPAMEKAEVKMLLNGPESFTPDGVFLLG